MASRPIPEPDEMTSRGALRLDDRRRDIDLILKRRVFFA